MRNDIRFKRYETLNIDIIQNSDITAICETKINDFITIDSVSLPGYYILD